MTEQRACLLGIIVTSALACACGEQNEGNVTTSPPPLALVRTPAPSGGSSSVLPGKLPDDGSPGPQDPSRVWPSSGCGKPLPVEQAETIPGSRTGYTEWHVQQTGATLAQNVPKNAGDRQFFVRVPADYDPNRPYRVVYIGQGCGSLHGGKLSTDPLFDENRGGTEQAVYVGISVPDNDANPGCYDNNNGPTSQEWEAFDLMHTLVESKYCVDNNRIFVSGYSSGGWLANMYSCYFGGVPEPARKFSPRWPVRGGARMTGSLPPNQPTPCNGPAAGIWVHDALDKANLLATNIAALNLALQSNGCHGDYENGPKEPWAPAEEIEGLHGLCMQYTDCPADVMKNYPLVFCTTDGFGHADQPSTIPAFTRFFDLMNPAP